MLCVVLSLIAVPALGQTFYESGNLVGRLEQHGDRTYFRDYNNNFRAYATRHGNVIEYRDYNNNVIGTEKLR
jgi:hypothetical protein